MQVFSSISNKNSRLGALLLMGLLLLLAWRLMMSRPGLEARGSATWVEKILLLFLYQFWGLGLGRFLLRYSALLSLTKLEFTLLAYLFELGCLSVTVMVLGLVGWLNTAGIFFLLAISGVITWNEFRQAEEECASVRADRWINVVQPVISGFVVAGARLVNLLAWGKVWR